MLNAPVYSDMNMKESSTFSQMNNRTTKPLLIKKNRIMQKSASVQAFFDSYSVQNVDPIDWENLNENIVKANNLFQRKNRELNELQNSYQQLIHQSKNHIRVIEAILSKSSKISNSLSNLSSSSLDSPTGNKSNDFILIQPSDSKLISNYKSHLIESKAELDEWMREYEVINQSEKVIKMRESERKLAQCEETIRLIENKNKQLQNAICEIHKKLTGSINTEVNYKSSSIQMQFSSRDLSNQLDIAKNVSNALEVSIAQYEQTMEKNKVDIIQLIEQIKQREDLISKNSQQKDHINGIKQDKLSYEKRMTDIAKRIKMTQVDIEKAEKKLKDLENNKEYLTAKYSVYEQEKPKLVSHSKDSMMSFRDKDKKIKELHRELSSIQASKESINKQGEDKIRELTQKNAESKEQIETIKRDIEDSNEHTTRLEAKLAERKRKVKESEGCDKENAALSNELNKELAKAKSKNDTQAKEEYFNTIKDKKDKLKSIEEEIKKLKDNDTKLVKEQKELMLKVEDKNKKIKQLRDKRDNLDKLKRQSLLPNTIADEEFRASLNEAIEQ